MADQFVKFVSKTELNAKKEEKRKAREQLLQQAKSEYEREERRREKRKAAGEDTWMLPSVSDRIADEDEDEHRKKKKRKKEKKNKEKKNKKHKKKSKREKNSSSDSDSDEWVEKEDPTKPAQEQETTAPPQRDGWMLFPCFSEHSKSATQQDGKILSDEETVKEEENIPAIDVLGKHSRELNPYWKNGGTGLPTNEDQTLESEPSSTPMYDVRWLKKALQRSKEQAEEEGRSLEDVVAFRWGSLEQLETMISEAEQSEHDKRYGKQSYSRERSERKDRESSRRKDNERQIRDRTQKHYDDNRDFDRHASYSQNITRKERNNDGNRDFDRHSSYSQNITRKERNNDGNRDKDRHSSYHHETTRKKKHFDDSDRNSDKNYNRDSDKEQVKEHGRSLEKERSPKDSRDDRDKDYRDKREQRNIIEVKNRLDSRTLNPFKRPDSGNSKSSSKFIKPSDDSTVTSTTISKPGSLSGGWRKKSQQEPKVNRIELAMKKRKDESQQDSSSDSPDSENDQELSEEKVERKEVKEISSSDVNEEDKKQQGQEPVKRAIPTKKITEADLNNMGAKILKAELMGDEDAAAELKASLEQMRADKEAQESSTAITIESREQEVVLLTRTDKFGNTRPVTMNEVQEPKRGRRKREKVNTHGDSGQRERFFADDDQYDLNEMVRREKMNTAEDYNDMFSRLASKGASKTDSDNFTLDDHFVTGAANKFSKAKEEEREKMRAIKEHQRLSAQLSKCRFCFENPDLAKHLIIAIGLKVYLALPLHTSLTNGHCLIIPMQHQVAYTYLDEDVIDEIKIFKKGLTRMFQDMEKDVIFLETCRNLTRQNHMNIECIPVPKEEGALAPMYFKKAILESDSEWAHNKKLIDTSKKGLTGSIPKGLPYFSVEFGLDGGFAHVVEDEHLFPHYFGKEIIGGMLDVEPWTWHKPHRENFEQHKKKVLEFADWWKPYDWTKKLKNK